MRFYSIEIQDVIDETDNARSFILAPGAVLLPKFYCQPGQFLTFHVPLSKDDKLTQSAYFSGAPATDKLKITIKHETNGSDSNWIYNNLKVGDQIEISPPRGNFSLNKSNNALVLIVDDNGIIPIFSLLKNELHKSSRTIKLFYDCQNYNRIIFRQEIDRLRKSLPQQFECLYHLNIEPGNLKPTTLKAFINNSRTADFAVCGLESHINFTAQVLAELDIDKDHIQLENCSLLNQQSITNNKDVAEQTNSSEVSHFRATLDGKEHKIKYLENKTLLECMLTAGLEPYFSCSDAHCGYCMAVTKSGKLTMQKTDVLSPGDLDRGYILLCQAIPLSGDVWVDCDA